MCNISIRCMRISQNLDLFLPLPVLNYFSVPFPFLFLALLLSLTFSLHILSGCSKKLGVNYGQSLEMDLDYRHSGPFYHHFLHLNGQYHFSIYYLRMWSISQINCCAERSILALPSAYYEHLVSFKLMTSQVVQRTLP